MLSRRSFPLIAGSLLAPWFARPVGAQNLLVNGGFEEPVVSGWSVFPSIPGWSSTGAGIEIQRGVAGTPFEGAQLMELDSFGTSSAVQDFATIPGVTYRLHLTYSARPGVADNQIDVQWDGLTVLALAASGVGEVDTVWTRHEIPLMASTPLTRLELIDRGPSDGVGGYLDDVCVSRSGVCVLTLAVKFDELAATIDPTSGEPTVTIAWTTASEEGTVGFIVERGEAPTAPFVEVGEVVGAVGPGYVYTTRDQSPGPLAPGPWYRVVELTVDGVGSTSPAFQPDRHPAGSSGRSRTNRHRP